MIPDDPDGYDEKLALRFVGGPFDGYKTWGAVCPYKVWKSPPGEVYSELYAPIGQVNGEWVLEWQHGA